MEHLCDLDGHLFAAGDPICQECGTHIECDLEGAHSYEPSEDPDFARCVRCGVLACEAE